MNLNLLTKIFFCLHSDQEIRFLYILKSIKVFLFILSQTIKENAKTYSLHTWCLKKD